MAPLHPSSRHRRQLGLSPNSQSYTLDDSSPQITYTVSFPTAQIPPNCAQTSTCTYQNTLHQTSSAAGSASFKFTASQIYIYGVKGPGFGSFSVTIDGIPEQGTAQATSVETQVLIYSKRGLDPAREHQVILANGAEGKNLALDFISTSPVNLENTSVPVPLPGNPTALYPPGAAGTGAPAPGGGGATVIGPDGSPVVMVTQTNTAAPVGGGYGYGYGATPVPSAGGVFGSESPYGTEKKTGNDNSTGIAVGVSFLILSLIVFAFLWYRYRRYRLAGGKGSTWEAFFGKSKKKGEKEAKEEQKDNWKNWGMVRYVPKYTFGDMAEDNEKKDKEEEKKKAAASSRSRG